MHAKAEAELNNQPGAQRQVPKPLRVEADVPVLSRSHARHGGFGILMRSSPNGLGGRGRQIWQAAHPPVAERIFAVRRETGKEQVVRVHYDEGLANRIGPKPCAGTREGASEASVGERIGQPLSHENSILGADAVAKAEGNTDRRAIASAARPGGVREPGMCGHSLRGNREISCLTRGGMPPWPAPGRRGAEAGDARA